MKLIITMIISLSLFGLNAFSQENESIIDPIFYECFRLKSNEKVKPLKLEGDYFGRIILSAECDTINKTLKNHKLLFAKLRSNKDPNDSIEIRLDFKLGNYKFIEEKMYDIIHHITDLKIERHPIKHCEYIPQFSIPIKIESKN